MLTLNKFRQNANIEKRHQETPPPQAQNDVFKDKIESSLTMF